MTVRPLTRPKSGPRLAAVLIGVAVVAAVAWMGFTIGNPFPPRAIHMATGPRGSAYDEFGQRYRQLLQRSGVDLVLVPTAGGVDNLGRLRDPRGDVSVAFVESGLTTEDESAHLVSLGTVVVEPLWVFTRGNDAGTVAQRM